jgi:predicted O-methyltransferase YrrM
MFATGDAVVLAGLIRTAKPRRIIEVGSGFSSSVILDTLDQTPDLITSVTFIEPYTERLERLLRPEDSTRAEIIRSGVQEVSSSVFEQLDSGNLLFLDTTHISKTGSDVNHEVIEILPRLKSGVLVHFHDVFDGFEYPSPWIYEQNRSWNELYLLRAFLMYNEAFEVIFANDAFVHRNHELVSELLPAMLDNPGGAL